MNISKKVHQQIQEQINIYYLKYGTLKNCGISLREYILNRKDKKSTVYKYDVGMITNLGGPTTIITEHSLKDFKLKEITLEDIFDYYKPPLDIERDSFLSIRDFNINYLTNLV